jgi:ABC-type transporter MlaC component
MKEGAAMKESIMRVSVLALLCATCCTREAAAQPAPVAANEPSVRPYVDADGVAHLPALSVPASRFMSPEARSRFIKLFSKPALPATPETVC